MLGARSVHHNAEYFDAAVNEHLDTPLETKTGKRTLQSLLLQATQHPIMQNMHNQPLRLAGLRCNDNQKLQDFGGNVEPVFHGIHIMRFTAAVVEAGLTGGRRFDADSREIAEGLLTAETHDIGEAKDERIKRALGFVVGDIPHGKKTAFHRRREEAVYRFALPQMLPELSPSTIDSMWGIVSHDDKDRPMWKAYKAGHVIAELEAGIGVGHKLMRAVSKGVVNANTPKHRMRRYEKYAVLAGEVMQNHLSQAREWADEFTLIDQLVNEDYAEYFKWHEETGGFGTDREGIVYAPEGFEEVLEKSVIHLPRAMGNLGVLGYKMNPLPAVA